MPDLSFAALRSLLPQMSGANFGTTSPQEDADMPLTGLDKAVQGGVSGIAQQAMVPGQLARPNPYPEGSEAWSWYNDQKSKAETHWAPEMALTLAGGAGVVPAEANSLRMGIKAYHGSPHDFDAFDLSKIGTGEGAQAYGHGLYFAENPGTAEFYRSQLAGEPDIASFRMGDMRLGPHNQFDYTKNASKNTLENIKSSLAEDALIDQAGLVGAPDKKKFVMDLLDSKIADYKESWPEGIPHALALRKQIDQLGVDLRMGKRPGSTYEVNINADPSHLLDWDQAVKGAK